MSTTFFSPFPSDSISIPNNNEEQSYKDIIKQLAAQAPEPYGAIPPLKKKKKKTRKLPIRRMSHVENWVAVDSKESIPDEQDLKHSSPFRNFLSTDFLVLPLHMPPPSLSAPPTTLEKPTQSDPRPILFPLKKSIPIHNEEDEEEETDEETDEEEEETDDEDSKTLSTKKSIPSFSKSQQPSISTTRSYAMSSSSSPPNKEEEPTRSRWLETLSQLRKSFTTLRKKEKPEEKEFIPMPLPPKRNIRKRRSEATTQPRFNPETNTYTRDTRSNPDHLRMISAELNMMRSRKLSSPLKPRGFLPRRTDPFIGGDNRRVSNLYKQL